MSSRLRKKAKVTAIPAPLSTPVRRRFLQRQVEPEEEEEEPIQVKQTGGQTAQAGSKLGAQIRSLKGSGQPLSSAVRGLMEPKLGHDFGRVRVHTDAQAAEAAKAVSARAFTLGQDVVFGAGQYEPGTVRGRGLLAHELAHVAQQSDPGTLARKPAGPTKAAKPRAKVGPVPGEGGLLHDTTRKRLSVIVGADDTLRSIAKKLLPMWNTAEPFKPEGASSPVPFTPLTEEQLAKGLLVYNRYYLAVPFMTRWKAGLRFPLPVIVNRITRERTLHPELIARWASTFKPEWTPLLGQKPKTAKTSVDVHLKLAVRNFLLAKKEPWARGIHLSAKAMSNALEAEPFIKELFDQLGTDGFATALGFMNNLVNHQLLLLASQRPGLEIIYTVREVLSKPPAKLSEAQQKSLTRAQLMLSKIGVFSAEKAETFKKIYIKKAHGTNCMVAVYKGLEALFSGEVSKSISSQVFKEAEAYRKKTRINTNNMVRLMETVRARGKAGPPTVLKYNRRSRRWDPNPQKTILDMTHPKVAGWYFFGLSLHGAYHSVILAVDKTDPAKPRVYWMDQFTKGFTKEVTGKLEKAMKKYKPSYGFAASKVWQIIPAADTLVELR